MGIKDLRDITFDWPYESGRITVRKVRGLDGKVKIQMRVDLGVLQMDMAGRPDGQEPFGHESLLEYHLDRIARHKERNGTELGFSLTSDEVHDIQEEAMQYYQRYLANFVLEEYGDVARDTQRNLRVLDLCLNYAHEDEDRYALEPYRPYICMMNARSKAMAAMNASAYRTALAHVETGLKLIRKFFKSYGDPDAFTESSEADVLRMLRQDIRAKLPADPVRKLRRQLKRAVREERYEDAAKFRDQLQKLNRSE